MRKMEGYSWVRPQAKDNDGELAAIRERQLASGGNSNSLYTKTSGRDVRPGKNWVYQEKPLEWREPGNADKRTGQRNTSHEMSAPLEEERLPGLLDCLAKQQPACS